MRYHGGTGSVCVCDDAARDRSYSALRIKVLGYDILQHLSAYIHIYGVMYVCIHIHVRPVFPFFARYSYRR